MTQHKRQQHTQPHYLTTSTTSTTSTSSTTSIRPLISFRIPHSPRINHTAAALAVACPSNSLPTLYPDHLCDMPRTVLPNYLRNLLRFLPHTLPCNYTQHRTHQFASISSVSHRLSVTQSRLIVGRHCFVHISTLISNQLHHTACVTSADHCVSDRVQHETLAQLPQL